MGCVWFRYRGRSYAIGWCLVATIEFRFRAIVLIEKFVLDVAYEKIGVARSHFCAHGHTIDLFIIKRLEF